jgi:hypothetical protein
VEYYRKRGYLHMVNGELPVEEVTHQTLAMIEGAVAA